MRRAVPFLLVLGATISFRLPVLLNSAGLNSDAAVVGLQARHMLQGEWSPFLWGTGYQASIDAAVAALAFAIAGARPLTLTATAVLAHLLVTWFAWDVLRRRAAPWVAAMLVAPLVFAPMAVSFTLFSVARSWSIAAVFAAIWLLDGAAEARRPLLRYAAGCGLALLAAYFDLYTLLFLPGVAIFAAVSTLAGAPRRPMLVRRWAACAAGAGAGLGVLWSVRAASAASSAAATLTLSRVRHNLRLLADVCLPWALSSKTFVPGSHLYPDLWTPPAAFAWIQKAGLLAFLALLAVAAVAMAFRRSAGWQVERMGLLGLVVALSAVAGFLLSPFPTDMWSARYLAPLVYAAPFALAAAYGLLGSAGLAAALLPYLLSAAVSGWLGYGDSVEGPWPVVSARGAAKEERRLGEELRRRGIRFGAAQYWLSYRLTFLFEENPVLVPLDPAQDRYAPYREAVASSQVVAFVFHPSEPRARPEPVEALLRASSTPYERLDIEGFTILVARRRPDR